MPVYILGAAVHFCASLYLLVLFGRMILDWIRILARDWHPRATAVIVIGNVLYALTDPPLRFLRRYIPPLRLGNGIALDVGFMVLFIGILLLQRVARLMMVFG